MKITRRLLFFVALLTFVGLLPAKDSHNNYLLFIGTQTGKDSKGIYAYRYNAKSGELASLGLAAETTNPSFLAVDPDDRYVLAVNEVDKFKGESSGGVSAFSVDRQSGKLTLINDVPSGAPGPCFLSFDRSGKHILVANYSGSVAVFPALDGGRIGESSALVKHSGAGPNADRQEGPHPHWIGTTPDDHFALVADLGNDQLFVYRFDSTKGTLTRNDPPSAKLAPGSGPRHVAFHPNGRFVYIVNELLSTVSAFVLDSQRGVVTPVQTISTLPAGFSGQNDTAEIEVHSSGKFLFASNRGHDSIAVFSIDQTRGSLTSVADVPTLGKVPRNFEIDPTGSRLFVANQKSNNIVVFRIDARTGALTPTGQVLAAPNPVSLKFVRID